MYNDSFVYSKMEWIFICNSTRTCSNSCKLDSSSLLSMFFLLLFSLVQFLWQISHKPSFSKWKCVRFINPCIPTIVHLIRLIAIVVDFLFNVCVCAVCMHSMYFVRCSEWKRDRIEFIMHTMRYFNETEYQMVVHKLSKNEKR